MGLGVQQKENVVVLPILPWIPARREMLGELWGFSAGTGAWAGEGLVFAPRCIAVCPGRCVLWRWESAGRVYCLASRGELQ